MSVPNIEEASLSSLMLRRVEETPDASAWIETEGLQRSQTWAELQEDALEVAAGLRALGVSPGDVVPTMVPNGGDAALVWSALSFLGAVEMSVNTAFQSFVLENALAASGAEVAIVHSMYESQWTALNELHSVRTVIVITESRTPVNDVWKSLRPAIQVLQFDAIRRRHNGPGPYIADPASPGLVLMTSGTTGPSKAVLMPWGQWWHRGCTGNFGPPFDFTGSDHIYSVMPTFHVGGREGYYRAAAGQGCIVTRTRFSASHFWSDVRSHGCTWAMTIGAFLEYLLSEPESPDDTNNPMCTVLTGPVGLFSLDFAERFDVKIFTAYGMSEVNNPIHSWPYVIDHTNYKSCGVIDQDREVRIVDEDGKDVPDGVVGEAWVKYDRSDLRVAIGYLNNREATEAAWKDGWFRTGDALMRNSEGQFFFVDRLKDSMRRRGENISSFEVEIAAMSYEGVEEVAAFAVPSSDDEEDEVMIAVVPKPDARIDCASLQAHLRAHLPFFAVPRYIEVVEDLPRTPTEKVKKAELRQRGVTEETWDGGSRSSASRN